MGGGREMNTRWGPKGRNECGAPPGDHPMNHWSQDACWVVGLRQQVGENLRESKTEERSKRCEEPGNLRLLCCPWFLQC